MNKKIRAMSPKKIKKLKEIFKYFSVIIGIILILYISILILGGLYTEETLFEDTLFWIINILFVIFVTETLFLSMDDTLSVVSRKLCSFFFALFVTLGIWLMGLLTGLVLKESLKYSKEFLIALVVIIALIIFFIIWIKINKKIVGEDE